MSTTVDAILFDFDGVIVDSVRLKGEVFADMIRRHAPAQFDAIMQYFWSHGGVSRLAKFRHIWANILHQPLDEEQLAALGREFSQRVEQAVIGSPYVVGADLFLAEHSGRWPCYVISGTPQEELRRIVTARGLDPYFEGVFGSPDTKTEIGQRIVNENGYRPRHVWMVGDATTERDAARELGIRFVGIDGPHLTPYLEGEERVIHNLNELAGVLLEAT